MTPEEFKRKARTRLRAKRLQELVWSDVASAVSGSDSTFKARIVEAIKKESPGDIGRLVANLMIEQIKTEAEAELDTIVADGQLSLDEFDRIFGD